MLVENIRLIAPVLSVIAFIGWIARFRPRAHRISQTSFIDYESNQYFEEMKFGINWGHVFFLRKIKLQRIERDATFKILCKPLGGIKNTLHTDNYNEASSGSSTNIYLVNKRFFKNNEIEEVFLEVTREISPDYRQKIQINITAERIEILNWNYVEIRSIPVELPKTITIEKMPAYFKFFSQWKTPEDPEKGIIAFVASIPPCKGGKPGKVIVPLN